MNGLDLDDQETATVLAALAHYLATGQGEPSNRTDAVHCLATASDDVVSLDSEGVEALAVRVLAHDPEHDPNEDASVCYACGWELP